MRNGLKIIQGGKPNTTVRPQPQRNAPLKPTREEILDLILDHWAFQEIAVKTRTSLSTVYAVNTTYMEQYMRQSVAGKLDAAPCVLERYREVELECWSEYGIGRRAA